MRRVEPAGRGFGAPWLARSRAVRRVLREGQDATGQTTLRWTVVLLFVLLAVASRFGLDVVLGAMLAGIVLRAWTRRVALDTAGLERKLDAVGYGIFIPIFSGQSRAGSTWTGRAAVRSGASQPPNGRRS
jgi:Kef-type K+ transport system membrane component KefB